MEQKIIKFNWNNAQDEEVKTSGNNLIIAQHLKNGQTNDYDETFPVRVYGISLSVIDVTKELKLHDMACWSGNVTSELEIVTKMQARAELINEIDKALDILYTPKSIDSAYEILIENEN